MVRSEHLIQPTTSPLFQRDSHYPKHRVEPIRHALNRCTPHKLLAADHQRIKTLSTLFVSRTSLNSAAFDEKAEYGGSSSILGSGLQMLASSAHPLTSVPHRTNVINWGGRTDVPLRTFHKGREIRGLLYFGRG